MPSLVVDEQNAHTEDPELPSPLEKDSEDENRDSEKDEDTKELEAVSCKCFCCFLACFPSTFVRYFQPFTYLARYISEKASSKELNLPSFACPLCKSSSLHCSCS